MKYNGRIRLGVCVATAGTLLLAYSSAFAAHSGGNITLRNACGSVVTLADNPTTTACDESAYSPKATCGACHDYGYGTRINTKTQGVLESDGQLYWQSYTVSGPDHGVLVGKHSNLGRNEDYSMDMRRAFGDPFFTSSAGMFGKF